jgi:hypothetical protein
MCRNMLNSAITGCPAPQSVSFRKRRGQRQNLRTAAATGTRVLVLGGARGLDIPVGENVIDLDNSAY